MIKPILNRILGIILTLGIISFFVWGGFKFFVGFVSGVFVTGFIFFSDDDNFLPGRE